MIKTKFDRKIGIISTPISKSGITPMSNLVDIMLALSNKIFVITGNEGYDFFKNNQRIISLGVRHQQGKTFMSRIINYIKLQIQISNYLLLLLRKVDIWFFSIGADSLLLPIILSKLFKKKVILILAGSSTQTLKYSGDNYYILFNMISNMTCFFSDKIIVYSNNLIQTLELEKYEKKIIVASRHFLDFEIFNLINFYNRRKNLVGYVGRLSKEKAAMTFVQAIPRILKKNDKIRFLIVGDGSLKEKIQLYIKIEKLEEKVYLVGWIPHNELPNYLNQMRLLVLPSYTEGLPNIMLEAMACGTPVLATPVGAIPDIIKDGETGFLLENNSPECIADNIQRALEHPQLEEISRNAKVLVEKNFTFDKAVDKYKKIFNDFSI